MSATSTVINARTEYEYFYGVHDAAKFELSRISLESSFKFIQNHEQSFPPMIV
jgi:hypothetical protein